MATSARTASLKAQRGYNPYSNTGKIRLLSPANNSVSSIAKKAATDELNVMVAKYNNGEVSNDEMRAFLQKMSGNVGLSDADKLDVQNQIKNFDSKIQMDALTAAYKNAPDNTITQLQAAQAIVNFLNNKAAGQEPGTPAQSQTLQDLGDWQGQVTSIKNGINKIATQNLMYKEELKVNALPDNTPEQAQQKADMYQTLYNNAASNGDEVNMNKYAALYQDAVTKKQTLQEAQTKKDNKKTLTDFINTTMNDYHDGKISGETALQQLEQANQFADDQGDTAALVRLNGLSVTINNEIDKGVTYSSVGGLSIKNSNSGGNEIYLNPDGSLSVGGGSTYSGGGSGSGGGAVSVSGGINPLIQKYFPKDQWATAQAVMLAESGGNAGAVGDNYPINGETIPSYGLFQIRGLPGRPSASQLSDPEFNVKYAAQMWAQQGWQPWSTYTNGTYRQYLNQAASPGNGAIITSNKTIGGSGGQSKSLSQLQVEYQNNLSDANKLLVQGLIPATSKNPKEKSYTQYVLLLAKERQLQLQNITKGYQDILNVNPKAKLAGKNVSDLQKDATTELKSVSAEYNGINSGKLVLQMSQDKNGNPSLQFVTKDKTQGNVDANGIFYPTRTQNVEFNATDTKAVDAFRKSNPDYTPVYLDGAGNQVNAPVPDGYIQFNDHAGNPVQDNFLDVTDTNGNTITYKHDATYGWLPNANAGPLQAKLRQQIISEHDAAVAKGQDYKFTPLTANQIKNSVNFGGHAGETILKPVEPSATDKIGGVVKSAVSKVESAVAPKPQAPIVVNPVAKAPPVQTSGFTTNPTIQSAPSSTKLTLPTAPNVAPSPVVKLATSIGAAPVKIPAPVANPPKVNQAQINAVDKQLAAQRAAANNPISTIINKIKGLFK